MSKRSIRRSVGLGVRGENYNSLYEDFERQAYLVGEEMAKTIFAQRRAEKAEKNVIHLKTYMEKATKEIKEKNNEINKLKKQIRNLSRKKGVKSASPRLCKSKNPSKRSRSIVTRRY